MPKRCEWSTTDAMQNYHDTVWGIPVHDDRLLFEFVCLESAQAGLSWATILAKRENYKKAFDNFDVNAIASYDQAKIDKLLGDPGIVRNRLKVASVVTNARAVLAIQKEFGSFDTFIWGFVEHRPIQNKWQNISEVPAQTDISTRMSTTLKKRGFKFIGAGICYSFMQAVGMVNDHTLDCFRHDEIEALSRSR